MSFPKMDNNTINTREYLENLREELDGFLKRIREEKEHLESLGISQRKIQALIEELENNLTAKK